MTTLEIISQAGIVPVVGLPDAEKALSLAEVLLKAEVYTVEVTLRTPSDIRAIQLMRQRHPELLLGAGMVLSVEMARQATDAGASYIVSPGFSPDLVRWCQASRVTVIPGVCTPTEAMTAISMGLTTLKFFPAELSGGVDMLRALGSVFGGIRFIPTGGIDEQNFARYLQLRNVSACGGSWVAPESLLLKNDFAEIEARLLRAKETVREARGTSDPGRTFI